jgi:hypothetical protein
MYGSIVPGYPDRTRPGTESGPSLSEPSIDSQEVADTTNGVPTLEQLERQSRDPKPSWLQIWCDHIKNVIRIWWDYIKNTMRIWWDFITNELWIWWDRIQNEMKKLGAAAFIVIGIFVYSLNISAAVGYLILANTPESGATASDTSLKA